MKILPFYVLSEAFTSEFSFFIVIKTVTIYCLPYIKAILSTESLWCRRFKVPAINGMFNILLPGKYVGSTYLECVRRFT